MVIRLLFLLTFINISLLACASSWDYNEKEFIFLEPRDMPFSNYSGNLKNPNIYNDIYRKYENRAKEKNLLEWKKQFNNELEIIDIEKIVYEHKNLKLVKNNEILDYLKFVKKQEIHVSNDYYTNEELKNIIDEKTLINEALLKIDSIKSKWLKLRYFYLAFRLAHYEKLKPLDIYEKYNYLLKESEYTIVKDWIEGIYAGALIKDKKEVKGVYEFSKLLDKDKINWHLSFYNFHQINTNEQWKELLNLAKNNEEKTKFYALRAMNKNSNVIEELNNIYKTDKNSKWFDFILYRELLNSQHFFNQYQHYNRDFQKDKFINFLSKIKKDNMYLVNLSLGYYNLYNKNLGKAKEISTKLLKTNNNHETQTLNYVINLNILKNIDLKTEDIIYDKMTELINMHEHKSSSLHDYTFVILKKLYKNQNNHFKSFLSEHINDLNTTVFDLETINKFKVFINKKPSTKLEQHFIDKYTEQVSIKKENDKILFNEGLKKAEVKLLINNLKFKEALNINSKYLEKRIQFNPFNVKIRGNNREGKEYTYILKEFLNKTIIIKNALKKNPTSAMDNYLYANALYNLSYFGNSNILTTVYRSVYAFHSKELEEKKINDSIFYYKKALKYSKKKEFKAKITYMLAKSELALYDLKFSEKINSYYMMPSDVYESERFWGYTQDKTYKKYIKNDYGEFFDKLKKEYSNTNYYKELIKECANLRLYQREKSY